MLGKTRTYDDIFTPDAELLDNCNLTNLSKSEKVLGICEERWYSVPSKYLGHVKTQVQQIFLSKPDTIQIEVTGKQIMEAIANVEQGSEEG